MILSRDGEAPKRRRCLLGDYAGCIAASSSVDCRYRKADHAVGNAVRDQQVPADCQRAAGIKNVWQLVGYASAAATQTPEAVEGLKAIMTLMPLAGLALSAALMWGYPLDRETHRRMADEVARARLNR